ncbi:hypothetical protein NC652_024041 [Populus alba x Populus x berolinensis]|nr:hypothetical protein NC652_024041 [Populus alba x Populus x berolinensis]
MATLINHFRGRINLLIMASTRKFSGNTLCSGLTSRSSGEQSKLTNVKRQLCLPSQNEVPKSLGGGDAASRKCHLCAEQMTSLLPLVIRRRKTRFGVVYSQSSSGYGVDSTGVQERLVLEEEERDIVNGSRDEEIESTGVPINLPHSSDVKHELIMLSLPAIAGQAIDPFAQLMETAFIGRLGPVELGSAGVSVMIFNNISKLFNIPLLSVATSFVAEDIAKNATKDTISEKGIQEENRNNGKPIGLVERKQLSSVSTALLLAIGIGIFEAVALSLGCGSFLNLMGITVLNKRVILLPPKIGELQFGVYMKSDYYQNLVHGGSCMRIWRLFRLASVQDTGYEMTSRVGYANLGFLPKIDCLTGSINKTSLVLLTKEDDQQHHNAFIKCKKEKHELISGGIPRTMDSHASSPGMVCWSIRFKQFSKESLLSLRVSSHVFAHSIILQYMKGADA